MYDETDIEESKKELLLQFLNGEISKNVFQAEANRLINEQKDFLFFIYEDNLKLKDNPQGCLLTTDKALDDTFVSYQKYINVKKEFLYSFVFTKSALNIFAKDFETMAFDSFVKKYFSLTTSSNK